MPPRGFPGTYCYCGERGGVWVRSDAKHGSVGGSAQGFCGHTRRAALGFQCGALKANLGRFCVDSGRFACFRCSRPAVPSEGAGGWCAVSSEQRTPCLSLWERWPSAARTERANKLILSFKKAVCPTGSGVLVFPSQSPAVTALPEGEPRACTSLHSKLT